MVERVLSFFEIIFSKCAEWTSTLLDAVGGKGVVLAAFIIVLVIGVLFIPMRGISLNVSFDDFKGFTRSQVNKHMPSKAEKQHTTAYLRKTARRNSK